MKKCLILILTLCLLLSACGGGRKMIGAQKAIEIAYPTAAEYADAPITKDMAVCELVDGCYEVTFDARTEDTLGISIIVIVRVDAFSGEIAGVMEAA
ncbi:MAG: hypothetical protein E7451_00960 [Ruminococcaceae bacterium]|nr:hypothetical protein [Oscillospiraceae bacterium]